MTRDISGTDLPTVEMVRNSPPCNPEDCFRCGSKLKRIALDWPSPGQPNTSF